MALTAFDAHVIAALRKRLAEELDRCSRVILDGTLNTYDEYKRLVGERRGFLRALEVIDETEKRAMSSPGSGPKQDMLQQVGRNR